MSSGCPVSGGQSPAISCGGRRWRRWCRSQPRLSEASEPAAQRLMMRVAPGSVVCSWPQRRACQRRGGTVRRSATPLRCLTGTIDARLRWISRSSGRRLQVAAHLVRHDVGLRVASLGPDAILMGLQEPGVDEHRLVRRAVERPDVTQRGAAPGARRRGEEDEPAPAVLPTRSPVRTSLTDQTHDVQPIAADGKRSPSSPAPVVHAGHVD